MKLRNKKTGEIGGLYYSPDKEYHFTVDTEDPADMRIYKTLSELNDEWEDYTPTKPLIKDQTIRKAVRAWADMNQLEKAGIQKIITEVRGLEDSWYQITGQDKNGCLWKIEIHASYSETVSKDYKEEE